MKRSIEKSKGPGEVSKKTRQREIRKYRLKTFGPPPPNEPAMFFIEDEDGKTLLQTDDIEEDWKAQGRRLQEMVDAANRGSA